VHRMVTHRQARQLLEYLLCLIVWEFSSHTRACFLHVPLLYVSDKIRASSRGPVPGVYPSISRDYEYKRYGTLSLLAGIESRFITWIGQPSRYTKQLKGWEDFDFPGTWRLLELTPEVPDIVHCHNLHGGYFDLRALPWLSQQVPVVLTMHDAWLLGGHCAHSFDCERWKTGCGECPNLIIYPAVKRDATAYNWRRKRDIYARSRLYVVTPSRWLMRKVKQSILAPAIVEARVIPNGVDLTIFHQSDRKEARAALGISQDAKMLLFTANGIRKNPWKDYQTMRAAIALLAERLQGQQVLFIALGENAPPERIGKAEIRFIPYQKEGSRVLGAARRS